MNFTCAFIQNEYDYFLFYSVLQKRKYMAFPKFFTLQILLEKNRLKEIKNYWATIGILISSYFRAYIDTHSIRKLPRPLSTPRCSHITFYGFSEQSYLCGLSD